MVTGTGMPVTGRTPDRRRRRASSARATARAIALSPKRLARLAIIAGIGVALAWLLVAHNLATRLRETAPRNAVDLAAWHGSARDALANAQLAATAKERSPATVAGAVATARAALAINPLSVSSWRVLGYAADIRGDEAAARKLIKTAESMSRRDSLTQLWLIEDAVRRDDIPGAMAHYDAALRTSRLSRDLLLPILVRATDDPIIRLNIAHTLTSNPPWREEFIIRFAAEAPSGPVAADLLQRLKRTGPVPLVPELALLVRRLAERGDIQSAFSVYRTLMDGRDSAALVRNGGFDRENVLPPIDWSFFDTGGVTASQALDRLEISAASDAGGRAAFQLLALEPGRYRLGALIGYEPGDEPASIELALLCESTGGRRLAFVANRATAPARGVDISFDVPSGCPAQRLEIGVTSETQPGGSAAWVDRVVVRPAAGARSEPR